jgi:hypothetical protein
MASIQNACTIEPCRRQGRRKFTILTRSIGIGLMSGVRLLVFATCIASSSAQTTAYTVRLKGSPMVTPEVGTYSWSGGGTASTLGAFSYGRTFFPMQNGFAQAFRFKGEWIPNSYNSVSSDVSFRASVVHHK